MHGTNSKSILHPAFNLWLIINVLCFSKFYYFPGSLYPYWLLRLHQQRLTKKKEGNWGRLPPVFNFSTVRRSEFTLPHTHTSCWTPIRNHFQCLSSSDDRVCSSTLDYSNLIYFGLSIFNIIRFIIFKTQLNSWVRILNWSNIISFIEKKGVI